MGKYFCGMGTNSNVPPGKMLHKLPTDRGCLIRQEGTVLVFRFSLVASAKKIQPFDPTRDPLEIQYVDVIFQRSLLVSLRRVTVRQATICALGSHSEHCCKGVTGLPEHSPLSNPNNHINSPYALKVKGTSYTFSTQLWRFHQNLPQTSNWFLSHGS